MRGWCDRCSPLGIACDLGIEPREKCPNFKGAADSGQREGPALESGPGHRVPWTGNTLGTRGLSFLSSYGRTRMVGIVGLAEAGKSTFLTMLYLLLARGFRLGSGHFAGSTTLEGWDNLARSLRLAPPDRPHFPHHTPVGGGRGAGLLHLSFRHADDKLLDLVLTDASGEWFRAWATSPESPGAEGARWIVEHAHAFLLFVDCAKLAGDVPEAVATLSATVLLAERLRDHARGRRVGVVWAKADHAPHPKLHQRLNDALNRLFPEHEAFHVTTEAVRDLQTERLESYLKAADYAAGPRPTGIPVMDAVYTEQDPFLTWSSR